jgi:hypothetical protein
MEDERTPFSDGLLDVVIPSHAPKKVQPHPEIFLGDLSQVFRDLFAFFFFRHVHDDADLDLLGRLFEPRGSGTVVSSELTDEPGNGVLFVAATMIHGAREYFYETFFSIEVPSEPSIDGGAQKPIGVLYRRGLGRRDEHAVVGQTE